MTGEPWYPIPDDEPYQHLRAVDAERHGVCLDCGDEWTENPEEEIVICPECFSRNVEERVA